MKLQLSALAAPGRPANAQMTHRTDTTVSIQWQAPLDLGGRKTIWYRVSCTGCPENTPGNQRRFNVTNATIGGLAPNREYSVRWLIRRFCLIIKN